MKENVIYFNRYLIFVLTVVLILCCTSVFGECRGEGNENPARENDGVTTVLLVRHADKYGDDLSLYGWVRAKKLAHVARKAGVTAIYTTNTPRTKHTVQPLAVLLNIEPNPYYSERSLVEDELQTPQEKVALVAGHSNTVLDIAYRLGANVKLNFINDFDNLYLVTCWDDKTNIINLQYGEESTVDNEDDIKATSCEMTTLLLVRHDAEEGDSGQRAKKLAHVAKKAGVTAIYTTDSNQTVEQLADALNIKETQYGSSEDDIKALINEVKNPPAGKVVVVSGTNDTLINIIQELGVSLESLPGEDEYDNLFVVTVYDFDQPAAKVVNLQYGTPSPPQQNISVVQVIDRTGSMGAYGYMGPAKTAAGNFIALMERGDQVGVVAFDDDRCDNQNSKAENVFPLAQITDGNVIDNAIYEINKLNARGCTSIGAGMQMAQKD
ncbi:MAG: VWA domain-containing protein, partial [Candidatus Aminicenantes bacterium]